MSVCLCLLVDNECLFVDSECLFVDNECLFDDNDFEQCGIFSKNIYPSI